MEELEELHAEAVDGFREDNWIGKPQNSVEMHLVGDRQSLAATSYNRLEPYLDDLYLLAISLDKTADEIHERRKQNTGSIQRLYRQFSRGVSDHHLYLRSFFDTISDQGDISAEFNYFPAEVRNLDHYSEKVLEAELSIRDINDCEVDVVSFNVTSKEDTVEEAYEDLDSSLLFQIHFSYEDPEAVSAYENYMRENNFTVRSDAVPGFIDIGDGEPELELLGGDKTYRHEEELGQVLRTKIR